MKVGRSTSESEELCGWFGIVDSSGASESDLDEEFGGSYLNIKLGSNGTRRSFIRCRLAQRVWRTRRSFIRCRLAHGVLEKFGKMMILGG